jgi:hypothetical protein
MSQSLKTLQRKAFVLTVRPNHRLERTAQQRRCACCWVPSSLRSSAAAQPRRLGVTAWLFPIEPQAGPRDIGMSPAEAYSAGERELLHMALA